MMLQDVLVCLDKKVFAILFSESTLVSAGDPFVNSRVINQQLFPEAEGQVNIPAQTEMMSITSTTFTSLKQIIVYQLTIVHSSSEANNCLSTNNSAFIFGIYFFRH